MCSGDGRTLEMYDCPNTNSPTCVVGVPIPIKGMGTPTPEPRPLQLTGTALVRVQREQCARWRAAWCECGCCTAQSQCERHLAVHFGGRASCSSKEDLTWNARVRHRIHRGGGRCGASLFTHFHYSITSVCCLV